MTQPRQADVLVIGAGPAGAAAAAALARNGLSVLMADDRKAAGDHEVLVSGEAVRALRALGLTAMPSMRRLRSVRLSFGRGTHRAVTDSGAVVCGRKQLRDGLRRAALAAGAVHIQGRVADVEAAGDRYRAAVTGSRSRSCEVIARHVVMAAGSAQSLTAPAMPDRGAQVPLAGIACARRFAGAWLRATALLLLIAPEETRADAAPTCAWAVPGHGATVTVGAASVGGRAGSVPVDLLQTALAGLADCDPRLAALTPAGPVISGPLDVGFTPERAASARYLLVGDAAGLVNPFTGEGLNLAIRSGLQAAAAIGAHPSDADAARDAYAGQLAAGFVGYFEAARHAARRYHLAWRVLGATARSDHPFFAKARRVTLLPEGLDALNPADHVGLELREMMLAAPFLTACDEVMITTVREQWPFLARLAVASDAAGGLRLRPGLLFLGALLAGGGPPEIGRATVAAGIELAQLGALALLGPPASGGPPPFASRGIDWAVATTVLAGDFLLAQASRLVAESAPEISWSFGDWLLELIGIRDSQLRPAPSACAAEMFASFFEFPARIGALLGGCSADAVQALRDAGYHCGRAFLHAEDVLALRGKRTRLDATLAAMLQARISAVPEYLGGRLVTDRDLARDPALKLLALSEARTACLTERERARHALTTLGDSAAARIFLPFITSVARPAIAVRT
jgi:menaquinone-9 beta-reductase